jgi:hypothetical protein
MQCNAFFILLLVLFTEMVKRAPALSAGLAKSIMSPTARSTSNLCLGILGSGVKFLVLLRLR